jgi:Thioredoxin like C-terminal domain/AhpC/TSA family
MSEAPSSGAAAELPVEGELADFDGANAWLNSKPLTPAGLRGKVVVVEFCTFSCVNWLRTLPYVRAWDERYRDDGLVVIGAHTPEFEFEHDVEKIRAALEEMGVRYPIAVDNDYAVWRAFDNNYWPALYFADAEGRLRHHHLGEEDYQRSERVIQQLLTEFGATGVDDGLVSVDAGGVYAPADWETLGSPETYVGYVRAAGFASPGGLVTDRSHVYVAPRELDLNEWSLSGDWTVGGQPTELNEPGGQIQHRFHARDVNLVMGAQAGAGSVRFRVQIDGGPPGSASGLDVDEEGNGRVAEERLYQLVREPGNDSDRTFEITFDDAGVQAYVFTFG